MTSFAAVVFVLGCGDGVGRPILPPPDGDADTDSGSDTGTGSASDTDTGSASESETGGDADTDTDLACPAGLAECELPWGGGSICTDLRDDPLNCGRCGARCRADQYCANGTCDCRPDYDACEGGGGWVACANTTNDPFHCGECGFDCPPEAPLCWNGECVAGCPEGIVQCGDWVDYCADLDTNLRNCGRCANECHTEEVCVSGDCEPWIPGFGCDRCPCGSCPDGTACCAYPGDDALVICVAGGGCP